MLHTVGLHHEEDNVLHTTGGIVQVDILSITISFNNRHIVKSNKVKVQANGEKVLLH